MLQKAEHAIAAAPSGRQMCEESMCSKEQAGELIKRPFMEISCMLFPAILEGEGAENDLERKKCMITENLGPEPLGTLSG